MNHQHSRRRPRCANTRLLAELRKQDMSLRRFAQLMDTSAASVWRIEHGHYGAPMDWYQRAALVLGVAVDVIEPETSARSERAA